MIIDFLGGLGVFAVVIRRKVSLKYDYLRVNW